MKFKSTTGEDVFIALTNGHTTVVGKDYTEIDKMFHKQAIALGCLPEGVEPEVTSSGNGFDRKKVIADAINVMLDGGNEKDFNTNGKPDLRALNARVGFTVPRDEADAIWEEVSKA